MTPEKRTVLPEDLFKLKFVGNAQLSPDGKRLAYTVSHVDSEKNKEYSAIWMMDVATGETYQFTSGTAKDSSPEWTPDGKQIAFMSTRSEKPQLYIIPVDGGEAQALTSLKQGVGSGAKWSPDGKQIAFTTVPAEEPRDPAKPYRVDRHVYRFNDLGYIDDVAQALYVVDVESGATRRLTEDRHMNTSPEWSPDGKEILYSTSFIPDTHKTFYARLRVISPEGGKPETLLDDWGVINSFCWLPDGKRITFNGAPHGTPLGAKSDLWVVDRAGGTPECRTAGLKVGVGGGLQADMPAVFWGTSLTPTPDGKAVYESVQEGGNVSLYSIAVDGDESWTPLLTGDRMVSLQSANAKNIVYVVSGINQPLDLYISDANGKNERQLTCLNDEWLASVKLPRYEHLLFPGVDGVQVEGWIMFPPEGEAPYPTLLNIHGGPHGAFGNAFHFDSQMMCGAGYAVLMVNHRASTGYGDEFSTAIIGDWGNLDYNDLMSGVDVAIEKGYADPDRLGVFGLSGGGNLSCWIVGNTRRFKAAVPENPVTNWVSMYGVGDISAWFAVETLGGRPHEIPEIYARCSPITYAHTCTTPTLLLQGEHDWRCPAEQSEQFYTTLKASGCAVEMMRFPNASHAASIYGAIEVRKAQNEATLNWMNRYVLGKTEQVIEVAADLQPVGTKH